MIVIDRTDPMPYYRQIHHQVVSGIESGIYRMGDRLPSIRSFAQQLGVSRNTVEQAYLMLVQEGYASARQGSGYYINLAEMPKRSNRKFDHRHDSDMAELREIEHVMKSEPMRYDFMPFGMEADSFPFYQWARISRDVMIGEGRTAACRPMDPRGLESFRVQIARYLAKEQDVVVEPEQVAVFPSFSRAIASTLRLLAEDGFGTILDESCRPEILSAASESGIPVRTNVFGADGLWSNATDHAWQGPQVYCTAPENRFPIDLAMDAVERERLVAWAADTGSYLLEDVYCHEFRFGAPHLPSLHAIDAHDRVIVVGSFAESLSPSMGMAYLALPPHLMTRWLKRKAPIEQAPWQTQATFAEFMHQDLWNAHLRRLQTTRRRKRDILVKALRKNLGDAVTFTDRGNGLYVLLQVQDGHDVAELVKAASRSGVRVYPADGCWLDGEPAWWSHVIVGYATIPLEDIEPGIAALARAWSV